MRKHQVNCDCMAYDFPHRWGGGKCNGLAIVGLNVGGVECSSCNLFNDGCEVLRGLEHPRECIYVLNFMEYNEVKL